MNQELKMTYETMGSSSYMAVTCPPDVGVVNYELEMMLSNEIENFLSVSRQMLDGDMVLYYNITSRISLKQVLDKRRLTRKELFRLIGGAIHAVKDAASFRLPAGGIVFEPEYIYVNPGSCAPAFLFIPIQKSAGQGIKELLSDLVLHDKIELSNDNFIQVLLMELNRQPFSLEQLEKSLSAYQGPEYNKQSQTQNQTIQQSVYSQPGNMQPMSRQPVNPQLEGRQPLNSQPASPPLAAPETVPYQAGGEEKSLNREFAAVDKAGRPKPENRKKDKKKRAPHKKSEENDQEGSENTFDAIKARKKFMLPQALVMVAAAACISFGLFTDESGSIVLNKILAFVIVIGLAEVILYREIYVNSKEPKRQKSTKTTKNKKQDRQERALKPDVPLRPEPHNTAKPQAMVQQPVQQSVQQPVMQQPAPPLPQPGIPVTLQPQPAPRYPLYAGAEDTDIGSETELWGGGEACEMPAYLEYFENGRLSRIPLDPINGTVIGRLSQQVDFVVKSPKVGKVHAKFFFQNGQYYVVDINSKNGTYINGNKIRIESNIPYPLHDKDRILLADSEFTIRCSED